jgi:hypothetical protein
MNDGTTELRTGTWNWNWGSKITLSSYQPAPGHSGIVIRKGLSFYFTLRYASSIALEMEMEPGIGQWGLACAK